MAIVQFVYSMRGLNRIITTTTLRVTEAPYFRGVLAGTNEISDVGFYPATTPVFILKNGKVLYQGALDEKGKGVNFVSKALDEILAGKEVSMPKKKPYG